jgi:hypothetical protein
MTRTEMLSELTDLLADTAGAGTGDQLASDSRKYAYLSEGQEHFCEDTGYFVDNTTFHIHTVAGTAAYAADPLIIKVLEVWESGRILTPYQQSDRPFIYDFGTTVSSAPPAYWQMDEQTGQIHLYPTPDAVYTVTLRAWRYPLLSIDGDRADPELPTTLQRACIEWAAYKILNHHDAELRNKAKANEHYEMYQEYVTRGLKMFRRRKGTQSYAGCQLMYQVR